MLRLAQAQPKIRIRGVLDRTQGAEGWAPTQQLKAAGVELYANKTGTGVRKLHHKLMVIDEELVIAGSFNYTEPATVFNDENIVVIGDTEVSDPGVMGNQQSLADYALTEIERIIKDLGKPV